jgi:hypothetical protein
MALTSAQETEYARLSSERQAVLDPNKAKFERFTPAELKAKVNILGIGSAVNWATECNYTDAEKAYVEAAITRSRWFVVHSDQVDPQESVIGGIMNEGITDADLQMLLSQNVLAAEQLRRIIAERLREELQAELDALKASSNGVAAETEAVVETA